MKALTLLAAVLLTGCTHPLLSEDLATPEPGSRCCPAPTTYHGWAYVRRVERCGTKIQAMLTVREISAGLSEPRTGYYDYEFLNQIYRDFGVSNGGYPSLALEVYAGGIPDSLASTSRPFLISFQRDFQSSYCDSPLHNIKILEIQD